jgi:hypothetical protein
MLTLFDHVNRFMMSADVNPDLSVNPKLLSTAMKYLFGVGLGRVVREVRWHPEDPGFEFQRWQ